MKEITRLFKLKKPCSDCPYVEGGLVLAPGRLEELKEGLMQDRPFFCHKTIDYRREEDNHCEEDGRQWAGTESYCFGAIAWQLRHGITPDTLIAGQMYGYADIGEYKKLSEDVELKVDD